MNKTFEEFLKLKHEESGAIYSFIGWTYSRDLDWWFKHAEQWAKESAPVKADLDKDIHITNGIDKKHHIVREFKERIYNETDNPIDPAVARKSLNCIQKMETALQDAKLQLEYLEEKYPTGTTAAIIRRINEALKEESER